MYLIVTKHLTHKKWTLFQCLAMLEHIIANEKQFVLAVTSNISWLFLFFPLASLTFGDILAQHITLQDSFPPNSGPVTFIRHLT